MGPNEISGLPAHILLVHVVIAVVPIAAVLVIVAALVPRARRWLNWLPPLAALGALVAVPITTHAGHWLESHLAAPPSAAIKHHVALGNQMFAWVLAMFVAALVVWALARVEGQRTLAIGSGRDSATAAGARPLLAGRTRTAVRVVVAAFALAMAVGAVQQVYRTGEAGSRAAWAGTFTSQPRS